LLIANGPGALVTLSTAPYFDQILKAFPNAMTLVKQLNRLLAKSRNSTPPPPISMFCRHLNQSEKFSHLEKAAINLFAIQNVQMVQEKQRTIYRVDQLIECHNRF
jgi:hypothetical protein